MYADLEQTFVERNGENRGTAVFCDDRDMSLLRVPEQFTGTLSDIAYAEDADGTHSASQFMHTNRSTIVSQGARCPVVSA